LLKIMKKIWGGILDVIDGLTAGPPRWRDTEYQDIVERLAIVKQAHYVFR
jgi:hypothetical protein